MKPSLGIGETSGRIERRFDVLHEGLFFSMFLSFAWKFMAFCDFEFLVVSGSNSALVDVLSKSLLYHESWLSMKQLSSPRVGVESTCLSTQVTDILIKCYKNKKGLP